MLSRWRRQYPRVLVRAAQTQARQRLPLPALHAATRGDQDMFFSFH